MKTYAEEIGRQPFNWWDALNEEEPDWFKLFSLAKSWVTCACGNQCAALSRYDGGMPVDKELRLLGVEFSEAIDSKDISRAKEILAQIEARSAQLLKEMEL